LSCLIRAIGWANAPRWGGGLRCWLATPPPPLPRQWTCSAVQIVTRVRRLGRVFQANCLINLINAGPCGPSTSAREGAGLWLEGPGFGGVLRKPEPLSWVCQARPACMEVPNTCRWCRIVARCAGTGGGTACSGIQECKPTGVELRDSGQH
jgi:hypothetical protein